MDLDLIKILLAPGIDDASGGDGDTGDTGGDAGEAQDVGGDQTGDGQTPGDEGTEDQGTDGADGSEASPDDAGEADGEADAQPETKQAAPQAFALSDRDRKILGDTFKPATIERMSKTPEGQAALRAALQDRTEDLLARAVDGDPAKGEPDGEAAVKALLDKALPALAFKDDDLKEIKDQIGDKAYSSTIEPIVKHANAQREIIGRVVAAHDSLSRGVESMMVGFAIEQTIDQLADTALGTSLDAALTPSQTAMREQLQNKVMTSLRGLGRTPTPRDILGAIKRAHTELKAPAAIDNAAKKTRDTMEKRAQHNGAVPRGTTKAPAPAKGRNAAVAAAEKWAARKSKTK
jgi:hypothetical protein